MNTFDVGVLDLAKQRNDEPARVILRRGDKNSTTITATITDHGDPADTTGLSARFSMRLPDMAHYYSKAATLDGNAVSITINEEQAASTVGKTSIAFFELLDASGNLIASTSAFDVIVLMGATDGTGIGESYSDELEEAMQQLADASEDYEEMREGAGEAIDAATAAASTASAAASTATAAASSATSAAANANQAASDIRAAAARGDFDGFSPVVDIDDGASSHTITITDREGDHSYTVPTYAAEESARAAAEQGRVTAETARTTAESARATAEQGRATAEQARVTAETARASAESVRVTAEQGRASAENARASAESARVTAESARASAETSRATAETARASAETARATEWATIKAEAEDATSAAEDATDAAQSATQAATDAAAEASRVNAVASKSGNVATVIVTDRTGIEHSVELYDATIADGSVTTAKLADGSVTDAKLAQTGGVLERVSGLQDTLLDTARVNLALSAFTAGNCVYKNGTVTANKQFQYASVQITADLVGVELYISGTAWYDITPYVFVGTSVVYPDTSTGSTLTQITDLSFTPTEVGTLYINKFDYGSTHHVGAAKYDEITSIKPSILPQPLPVKDTIDYDAVELTYTTSKLLNGETGLITDGSSENYVVTDYTAVLPGTKVMISAQHFYGQGLYAFYDENKQFISGRSSKAGGTVTKMYCEIVNVPTNAAYIVLGLLQQVAFPSCYLGQGAKQDALPSQMWSSYKWTCVGDSLTEYNIRTSVHYFDYVSAATGINVVNMGVSGSGYAKGDSYNFMTRISDVPTDSDVVTIFGSGNDGSAGLPLGTASDTGATTLGGVINTTIDNLYAIMPVVNLGIVTPTPWQGNMPYNNGFMENYSNLIVEICKRRSIPCLDLFHCSNLNPNSAEVRTLAYSKDGGGGTHPDELGHKLIAPRFKAFLETLLI